MNLMQLIEFHGITILYLALFLKAQLQAKGTAENADYSYTLESLIDASEIPTTNMDKATVVQGWRREAGKTTIQKIFLRQHLIDQIKEMDKFMNQEEKTRMYVSGPPGCGKTTFFLFYFTQWARTNQKCGLIVQYRDLTQCEIILLNGSDSLKRVVSKKLNRDNLANLVDHVLAQEAPISFCVFDGVRQNVEACKNVMSHINSSIEEQKAIHITSLEFDIKGGDGTGGIRGIDDYITVDSWKQTDYEQCVNVGMLKPEEWEKLLQTKEDLEEEVDFEPIVKEDTDSESPAPESKQNAALLALVERKFYYAGGSARFFFEYPMEELFKQLVKLESRVNQEQWPSVASLTIQMSTVNSVSSMMQRLNGKTFPVSRYIMYVAYTHCKEELVHKMKAVAYESDNPVMKGWAFELEQLHIVFHQVEAGCPVSNSDKTLLLPVTKGAVVVYDGKTLVDSNPEKKILVENSNEPFLIKCSKWNQGCFDIAFVIGKHLITVNFTICASHSLKVWFIRELKESLKDANRSVNSITHVAVVNDSDTLNEFQFGEAEGCGYNGGHRLYTIKTARAMKLVKPDMAELGTAENTETSISLDAKFGEQMLEFGVFVNRSSGRKKRKINRFDPSE